MAEEVAALSVRLEATAARFERDMQRASRAMDRATGRMQRRAETLDRRLERVGNRFGINLNARVIAATAAMAALGKAINDIVRNGDRLRQLEGRFRALTGSAERAGNLIQAAFGVSAGTGAPLEAVTEALTRFRIAGDAIDATDQQVAQLTETLLKLGTIGGSTAQELTAGAIQLGQGLASGRLQGEELRSVMENLPLVARQLADALGVSIGKLREMGAEGQLTADRVFGALLQGAEDVDRKFAELPLTVDRAANSAASAWVRFTDELDKSLGLSNTLARSLQNLAAITQNAAARLAGDEGLRQIELAGRVASLKEQIAQQEALFSANPNLRNVPGNLGALQALRDELAAARQEMNGLLQAASGRSREALLGFGLTTGPGSRGRVRGFGGTSAAPFSMNPPPLPPLGGLGPVVSGGGGGGGGSASAAPIDESAVRLLESLRERIELLQHEQQLVGTSAVENARLSAAFERQRIEQELLVAAAKEGTTITPEQIAQAKELAAQYEQEAIQLALLEEALRQKAEAEREAEEAARRHEQEVRRIADAITNAIQQADSFAEALRNVALQLANIAAQSLAQPGGGPIGQFLSGLFGGQSFTATATPSGALAAVPSAKGNVFSRGSVTPFAHGGIVNRPTLFPMARGAGLMGEAGPEAIMPLRRGPGGRLGVEVSGSGRHPVQISQSFQLIGKRDNADDRQFIDRIKRETVQAVQEAWVTNPKAFPQS